MKDIKHLLKDAREAIKTKDYGACLRICKSVLKEDKNNYMGLVFLGLSLQEIGPVEQASKAFKRAIQADSQNPLAWNGLINFYEKVKNPDFKNELLNAYISILPLETNEKKLVEYCEKLLEIANQEDLVEICKAVYNVSISGKCTGDNVSIILTTLTKFLGTINDLPEKCISIYENILSNLVSNKNTVTSEYYATYLTVLHKQNKYEQLFISAEKMHEIFETKPISLIWICKIFNQFYVEENLLLNDIDDKISSYSSKLLQLDNQNEMGLFTKGILLFKENKLIESKNILFDVITTRPGLIHAWVFLTDIYLKLSLYDEALHASLKADKLLQSINYSNVILKNILTIFSIKLLAKSAKKENWLRAIECFENIQDDELKEKCILHFIEANIKLENYVEAQLFINNLKNKDDCPYKLMTAKLLHQQKKYKEAAELLQGDNFDVDEWWIELGLVYWDLEEYKKCLMPFLKAAKCNPYNYLIYMYLGNFYEKFDDLEKAKRCYEKVVKINQKCSVAGTELSKIYRKLKKWDDNLNLLQSLTTNYINKNNCWAWLQLGLTYLDQEDYVKAVENLRLVTRIEPHNLHCWESLADAYFARGAYTSALKSYQVALELSENALYSSLQVANIKKILGEYSDARENFEKILLRNGQYIPALKGLAETCMHQARKCFSQQRLETARDHAQYGSEKIALALQQRSELSCLWKIFADCCFFVAKLPEKYSCLLVSKTVIEGQSVEGKTILEKDDLFSFATKCYCKAITLIEENILIWHDLGTCYLNHALYTNDPEKVEGLFAYALAVAKHCTMNNPTSWQHWNLLGNAAMLQKQPNYGLAQHAFIKAIIADHDCAVAWSNLGILYLLMDDIKLANLSFTQGQRSDPGYVNSWIGQGLIAESMNHSDAMDLYRHSTQLGAQKQGALGYGQYVCRTLLNAPPNAVIYSIHNMHAIPVACDALTWYTEKEPYNSCAWNMLGILQERMGLKLSAAESFKNAYRLSDKNHRDQARVNYGRLLSKLGRFSEAIDIYRDIEEATFNSGSGLALALFKDQQYEESYSAYEQALHWLTENESKQSDLLVALASMSYLFQGPDVAKTLLFQSIQLKPPSPWGLYATLSLGLLHNDLKLAKLVLRELENLKDRKECIQHYAILLSYFYLCKGEHKQAVREVSKFVHRHPDEPFVWLTLSLLLIRLNESRKPSAASANCARLAMKLGQTNMDVTKVLCLVSLGSYIGGDEKQALIAAQKAIHCFPEVAEGWAVLSAALSFKSTASTPYMQQIFKHIERLNPTKSLMVWSKKQQAALAQ